MSLSSARVHPSHTHKHTHTHTHTHTQGRNECGEPDFGRRMHIGEVLLVGPRCCASTWPNKAKSLRKQVKRSSANSRDPSFRLFWVQFFVTHTHTDTHTHRHTHTHDGRSGRASQRAAAFTFCIQKLSDRNEKVATTTTTTTTGRAASGPLI